MPLSPPVVIPRIRAPRAVAPVDVPRDSDTAAWRQRRNRALRQARWRCQACGTKRGVQVYPAPDPTRADAPPEALAVLCDPCAQQRPPAPPDGRVYLKILATVLARTPVSTVANLVDAAKWACAAHRIPIDPPTFDRAVARVVENRGDRFREPLPAPTPRQPEPSPLSRDEAAALYAQLTAARVHVMPTAPEGPDAASIRLQQAVLRQEAARTPRARQRRSIATALAEIFGARS
jgi:hypothetical protein